MDKEKLDAIVVKYESQIHELKKEIAELKDRNAKLLEQNEGKMAKKSQLKQAENDATIGPRRCRLCLPAELLCEMAKWMPWKVQQKQRKQFGFGKNMPKKKMKKNTDLLLANHALSTFLGVRFRQFRAIRKKNRVFKERTVFSANQIAVLENFFDLHKFITKNQQIYLAVVLRLKCVQVQTWFHNRRTKWRQQQNNNRA